MSSQVIEIVQELIRCPSVTPKDEGAQVYITKFLEGLGFECHQLPFGEVPNIFARIGTGSPHICFAGHTDVVPPGPEDKWTYGPFNPEIKDGVLYGRGVCDMKGGVAAFMAATAEYINANGAPNGSISFLITGDEEGVAVDGTVKVLEWMKDNGHVPDVALVGEPTNPETLGQEIKVGRRGSLTGELRVSGTQGHVAYPQNADNPIPRLAKMADALSSYTFDEGTEFFAPTNLEITTIDVGNVADNVIPESVFMQFNVRFNDTWSEASLLAKITEILNGVSDDYDLQTRCSGESFLTKTGDWTNAVKQAVTDITGKEPALTTSGGTSDARFVQAYCPVVECGGINASAHKIDENQKVSDLEDLTKIYLRILENYLK